MTTRIFAFPTDHVQLSHSIGGSVLSTSTSRKLMSESAALQSRNDRANPAPLGLFGFGMTTILLNLHNAGFFKMNAMILAMGLCYGGAAQIIAGILEFR